MLFFYYYESTGAEQQLFIFSEKNSYSYPVTHKARVTRELSSEIRFGVKPGTYGPPGRPTSVIKKIATFELFDDKKSIFVIRFFPQGQISSGTLYLLDRNNSCYALAHSISPYALFRVYKLEGELWKEQSLRDFVKL